MWRRYLVGNVAFVRLTAREWRRRRATRSVVIAGARPNFVKVAPLLRALRAAESTPVARAHGTALRPGRCPTRCSPTSRFPSRMSISASAPATHAAQTARVMTSFDEWLDANHADHVVTVGDVNSTLACALVAAKREYPGGACRSRTRSFDRSMPEEINRLAVDALATWLFTPSADADENLLAEGADPSRIHLVGNIMVDSLSASLERARSSTIRAELGVDGPFGLVTLHRPALVDDPAVLRGVVSALDDIGRGPSARLSRPSTHAGPHGSERLRADHRRVLLVEPVGYLDFLSLEAHASLVLTDSGGVQEETTVLGVPCLTLRENTERPITVTHGTNRVVGLDPDAIRAEAKTALTTPVRAKQPPLDGRTSDRIAAVLRAGVPSVSWVPPAVGSRRS